MSLLVAALVAAGAAAASSAVLVRGWLRRRAAARANASHACNRSERRPTAVGKAAKATSDAAERTRAGAVGGLGLGDVLQVDDETRWLGSGLLLRESSVVRCALWFEAAASGQGAVLSFPPPVGEIYWLAPADTALPTDPPSRLEIGGCLLDRSESFPAELEPLGREPMDLGTRVVAALYQGPSAEAAIVLGGSARSVVFFGRRIEAEGYDRLGSADPAEA